MAWSRDEVMYYEHCLQVNPTNNRYPGATARLTAGPLGWTIARSRRKLHDETCQLNHTPHRGRTVLRYYTDHQGQQWSQYLCEAHTSPLWVLGRKQDGTYPHYYFRGRRHLRTKKGDDGTTV